MLGPHAPEWSSLAMLGAQFRLGYAREPQRQALDLLGEDALHGAEHVGPRRGEASNSYGSDIARRQSSVLEVCGCEAGAPAARWLRIALWG
jgi:hypothetical protein